MRLRHSDWTKLFEAISQLNSDLDPSTLGQRAISTANSLISGEITAFDFFDGNGVHTGDFWYDPPNAISASEYEIFANVAHEHPFFPEVFGRKKRNPMTISDLLTTSDFHRTAIYNEYYRLYGVDHQLLVAMPVSDDLLVTYTYNRVRADFSREERLMIDLFAPHINNAIRASRLIEKLHSAEKRFRSALSSMSVGVVVFDHMAKLIYLSEHGKLLLHQYYGRDDLGDDGVPKKLAAWLLNCDTKRKADPMIAEFKLKLEKNHSKLSVTLVFDDTKREKMLLIEEERRPSPQVFLSLGLTHRQSEILFWVSKGKVDKDIGALLGISPRTVQKHLENIYAKLGVETRTAAILSAVENY